MNGALSGCANRIQAEQSTGSQDDPAPMLIGKLNQVIIGKQGSATHGNNRSPGNECRLDHTPKRLLGQTIHNDVAALGQLGGVHQWNGLAVGFHAFPGGFFTASMDGGQSQAFNATIKYIGYLPANGSQSCNTHS
jgi:hypothetical protein